MLPTEAFEKIAIWKAGNMPVQYRRSSSSLACFILAFEMYVSVMVGLIVGDSCYQGCVRLAF